jgi:hypothetical protein
MEAMPTAMAATTAEDIMATVAATATATATTMADQVGIAQEDQADMEA